MHYFPYTLIRAKWAGLQIQSKRFQVGRDINALSLDAINTRM